MKETPTTKEMDQLFNKLFDLSCDIGELASRAHLLEDKADELTGILEDVCRKLKWHNGEEEEEQE